METLIFVFGILVLISIFQLMFNSVHEIAEFNTMVSYSRMMNDTNIIKNIKAEELLKQFKIFKDICHDNKGKKKMVCECTDAFGELTANSYIFFCCGKNSKKPFIVVIYEDASIRYKYDKVIKAIYDNMRKLRFSEYAFNEKDLHNIYGNMEKENNFIASARSLGNYIKNKSKGKEDVFYQ